MRRRLHAAAFSTVLLLVAGLAGCGTVQTANHGVYEPWGGSAFDLYVMERTDSSLEWCCRAFDLPLSFATDAAMAPFASLLGDGPAR